MRSHRSSSKEPSQRQLRVGEQLRHIIADTLMRGHFHEEVLLDASNLSVTEVRCSPDLKNATAYIISLGGGSNMDTMLKALNGEAKQFQKEINRQSNLKFTPRVNFKMDKSFDNAQRIEDILRDVNIPED